MLIIINWYYFYVFTNYFILAETIIIIGLKYNAVIKRKVCVCIYSLYLCIKYISIANYKPIYTFQKKKMWLPW